MKGTKPQLVVDNDPVTTVPAPPAWLSDHAKAEWRRVVPEMVERGIFALCDSSTVENYCLAQGRVRELEADMQKANSSEAKGRLWRMQNQAMQTAKQLAAELGLTPVSRSRPAVRDLFEDEGPDLA